MLRGLVSVLLLGCVGLLVPGHAHAATPMTCKSYYAKAFLDRHGVGYPAGSAFFASLATLGDTSFCAVVAYDRDDPEALQVQAKTSKNGVLLFAKGTQLGSTAEETYTADGRAWFGVKTGTLRVTSTSSTVETGWLNRTVTDYRNVDGASGRRVASAVTRWSGKSATNQVAITLRSYTGKVVQFQVKETVRLATVATVTGAMTSTSPYYDGRYAVTLKPRYDKYARVYLVDERTVPSGSGAGMYQRGVGVEVSRFYAARNSYVLGRD